ncbi:MAG: hypothetical protein LCI03_14450 [Actinobacteria bacterium]|nr:hypothetical protein [Actinomycetota bacterium]
MHTSDDRSIHHPAEYAGYDEVPSLFGDAVRVLFLLADDLEYQAETVLGPLATIDGLTGASTSHGVSATQVIWGTIEGMRRWDCPRPFDRSFRILLLETEEALYRVDGEDIAAIVGVVEWLIATMAAEVRLIRALFPPTP